MKYEFILLSPLLVWSTPLGFPDDVTYACTNIQQVAEEEEEEETLHIDTCGSARVWVDLFGGLH